MNAGVHTCVRIVCVRAYRRAACARACRRVRVQACVCVLYVRACLSVRVQACASVCEDAMACLRACGAVVALLAQAEVVDASEQKCDAIDHNKAHLAARLRPGPVWVLEPATTGLHACAHARVRLARVR
jgi:hypothetical protein